MIKTILKISVFTALVLLGGQITVGSTTIAGHLERQLGHALSWSGKELKQTKLVAGLSRALTVQEEDEKEAEPTGSDPDVISTADRESLIRLLQ